MNNVCGKKIILKGPLEVVRQIHKMYFINVSNRYKWMNNGMALYLHE